MSDQPKERTLKIVITALNDRCGPCKSYEMRDIGGPLPWCHLFRKRVPWPAEARSAQRLPECLALEQPEDVCHGCGGTPDVPADATGKPACNNCYVCHCPVCKPATADSESDDWTEIQKEYKVKPV